MELKIKSEKVVEAANKCSNAKDILCTLFPEAFENENGVIISNGADANIYDKSGKILSDGNGFFLQIRMGGKYERRGFYLSNRFDWIIVHENTDVVTLVPTKKKK